MTEHKFKIGQSVYFHPKRSSGLQPDARPGAYQIVRRLPAVNGEFQYVMRSVDDDHQRVAMESELTSPG
jgi:hypothetical protein